MTDKVAVLAGPGVPPSGERLLVHLVDIAPTLMTLGRLPVPSHLDGRSFAEWREGRS